MTLLRVSAPLSAEKAVQRGIFAALKRYFEQKRRVLRQDDLVAVPIDAKASPAFAG